MSSGTQQTYALPGYEQPVYGALDFQSLEGRAPAAAMATVTLLAASGAKHVFQLPSDVTIKHAKKAAADYLVQPPQLQRWILDGSALGDDEVLGGSIEVFCAFLAPQFEITVKIVQFIPPAQSEFLGNVHVLVSPMMTVHSLKFQVAEMQGLQSGRTMRLFHNGSEMEDGKALEAYNLDPGNILELVARRAPDKGSGIDRAGMTDINKNYRIFMGLADTIDSENGKASSWQPSNASDTRLLRKLSNVPSGGGNSTVAPRSGNGIGQALLQAALTADDDDTPLREKIEEQPTTGLRLLRRLSGDRANVGHALLQAALAPDASDLSPKFGT